MKLKTILSGLTFSILVAVFGVSAIAQDQGDTSISSELTTKCKSYPQQPNIPNGTKASMDEMVAAQKAIKAYQAQAQSYRSCLDGVMAGWDSSGGIPDEIGQKKDIAVAFYNRSVADEEEVANLFNTSLRAYKGKTK